MDLITIHESHVNGQRRQMVNQINEYSLYDFWTDYKNFSDAVISYHRITSDPR